MAGASCGYDCGDVMAGAVHQASLVRTRWIPVMPQVVVIAVAPFLVGMDLGVGQAGWSSTAACA